MPTYIYQSDSWPRFTWDENKIQFLLGQVRHLQGRIHGRMESIGFQLKDDSVLSTFTNDVTNSSKIEGESLPVDQVRSSIARKLGLKYAGLIPSSREVDGVVDMTLDATQNFKSPLSNERLFSWQAALFPNERNGFIEIRTGKYRIQEMNIVSGPMGMEQVHYEAPPPSLVPQFMNDFLVWFNSDNEIDLVLKSAIAHFWFIIIHPFDDGNGRIARAISDLLLARSEDSPFRLYSLSSQILTEKKQYYRTLQIVQHNESDITMWIVWYLETLMQALLSTQDNLKNIFLKTDFWEKHKSTDLNSRQRVMLNKLLEGFEGKLKSSKWAKITKCSMDTALRDIKDLIDKGILRQGESGGRSVNYELVDYFRP